MNYYHVDVFSRRPLTGNGLTVFIVERPLDDRLMLQLTQEMRQFESIFLNKISDTEFRARIYTMEEELDFAGHPILGASAVLHQLYSPETNRSNWKIHLNASSVEVNTTKESDYFLAEMNQGKPQFIRTLNTDEIHEFLRAFNLATSDAYDLPFEVVSTGLPYLIVPVKSESLAKCNIILSDLESKLQSVGAKFAFILDVKSKRGRTWDNLGSVEDVATGSSAGPVGAYFVKHGLAKFDELQIISQGEFLKRPSQILVNVTGFTGNMKDVFVSGEVCNVAQGKLTFLE